MLDRGHLPASHARTPLEHLLHVLTLMQRSAPTTLMLRIDGYVPPAGEAVLGGAPLWHPQELAGFVGVSGAYDLEGLAAHLHRRGLYKNLLDTIMSIDGKVRCSNVSVAAACKGIFTPCINVSRVL